MRDRTLAWEGCANVRDLGGHPTEDGRSTRFGAVVRADSRTLLTEAGWEALAGYGVSRVVDLRRDDECRDDPPDRLHLAIVRVSLMDAIERPEEWELVKEAAAAAPDGRSRYVVFYDAAIAQCRSTIAAAVAAVADAPQGCVVVHCAAGKDRTGLVAALLLRLCGVPLAEVDADYAASEQSLRAARRAWIEEAADSDERARRLSAAETPAGAMTEVLERLERRHGSVAQYLASAGLAPVVRDRLRSRMLA